MSVPESSPTAFDLEMADIKSAITIACQLGTVCALVAIAAAAWSLANNYAAVHAVAIKEAQKAKLLEKVQAIDREAP